MASSVALIGQTAQTPALINNSMDMTMERIRKTQLTLKTLAAILIAVSFTGCGKPMLYHFKHYHGPFEAVARSNKTYFHSGQTGKIIEKDPCMKYCEPGCFGYEPTCWTRWPEECANCPVQGDVVDSGLPYDGQIIMDAVPDGSMGAPMPSYETHQIPPTANPAPVQLPADPQVVPSADETRLPAVRVPSLPADVESAIPSPSDSTRYQARQTAAPNLAARAAKPKAATPMTAISSTPSTYQVPTGFKTQNADSGLQITTNPAKAQEQSLAAKTSRIEAPKTSPMLKAQAEPIQTARIALPTKSVTAPEEPAAEVAKVPSTLLAPTKKKVAVKSNRSTKPTSSRRRAETLAEKLRVRPTPVSADSYFAAVESIATESKVVSKTPASKQVVAKPEPKTEAQKPQMLKIVQSTDSPKKSKARVSQELPTANPSPARTEQPAQSTVQFGRLANKLKNAKTPTLSLQQTAKPKVEESNPAAKRNKLSTLRVSDTGSSEIRFAGKSSAKKQRLGTLSTGTELRFSSKTE